MKDAPRKEPPLAKELRATRKPRRREHTPKPNLATWLLIAWLAFMAAWAGKHFYRKWVESFEITINATSPVKTAANATGVDGKARSESDSTGSSPLE